VTIREQVEAEEYRRLSPYAQKAAETRGRRRPEEPCSIRTEFQRDRDRIIHSKAFRRLKDKTQVFLAPEGDHFRTRLTHTLEVAQIARTIARALRLNEDLTEAIALGHDLGHTPFGHAGEDVLNELHPGGFRHYEQSLRVVDLLEGGRGLNLTEEVRDGIANHTAAGHPLTLEARVVHLSDRIAYVNHDIDDALRGGVIHQDDLPAREIEVLGRTHSARIDRLVRDVIESSRDRPEIRMSDKVWAALDGLRDFLFERVYVGSAAKREEEKAKGVVRALYLHYLQEGLPDGGSRDPEAVRDYVAGMTDRFAMAQYRRLFLPHPWQQE
jgi:dGTPase